MTTLPTFPTLPGQGWSTKVTPTFSTKVASHVSGREVRAALYARPLYQFELTYEALDSLRKFPGLQAESLQTLLGFYLTCQGQFGTFLYVDPENNIAANQAIGTGDGQTTTFILPRSIAGFTEPVSYATAVTDLTVGGATAGPWSLSAPNELVFTSAPPTGAAIVGNVAYGFLCRFLDDTNEFEEFMSGLWQVTSLKFRSVR